MLSTCINFVLYQMENRREDALKKCISFFEFSFCFRLTHLSPFEQKKDERSLMRQGSLQRQGNYEKSRVKKTESKEIKVITSTKLSKSY